jgi:hypothetical protein
VANYLVRLWVTTHLGTATVERLPVPKPTAASLAAARLRDLGRELLESGGHKPGAYAEVQALAASLYGLSADEFTLVLESFPLIEAGTREAAADCHRRLPPPSGGAAPAGIDSAGTVPQPVRGNIHPMGDCHEG